MITKLYIIINKYTEEVDAITEHEWMKNEYIRQCNNKHEVLITTDRRTIMELTEYNKEDLFLYTFKDIVINRKEYDFIVGYISEEYNRLKTMIKDIKVIINSCNLPESHVKQLMKTRRMLKDYVQRDNIFDVFNLRDCILDIQEDRRLKDTIDRINELDRGYLERVRGEEL